MLAFFNFISKLVGIIAASWVSHGLATTKITEGPLEKTHSLLATILELGAIAIIFLA